MNYGYLIIYKKNNGNLLYRSVKNYPQYHKGDITSMGWTVIDIQRLYNGKIYSVNQFDNMLVRRDKIHNILTLVGRIDYATLLKLMLIGVVLYIICVKL